MAVLLADVAESPCPQESPKLTARQQCVLTFLREFMAAHSYPPSIRQIGEHFGFRSPNGVMYHLLALERKGLIVRDPMTARGIRLVNA